MISHPDHSHNLHDVADCPTCVTRLDASLDPRAEVPRLRSDLEPVPDAPGWWAEGNVTAPAPSWTAPDMRGCGCLLCHLARRGPHADRLTIDDVIVTAEGLEVSGHLHGEVAQAFGVPASLLGHGGYAEPDWSDPDAGTCQTWHDRVPPDSHCAVCLWAPRDDGAFTQTIDPCVCQPGLRHSCGRSVGTVPIPPEQERDRGWFPQPEPEVAAEPERGRLDRWIDRNGWNVVYWLGWLCYAGMLNLLAGKLPPAAGIVVAVAAYIAGPLLYLKVRSWLTLGSANPAGMPGWEIRRGRTWHLPHLTRRGTWVPVGVWRWRHSLDGGPWSPWWFALTHARAQRAVGRWLPFPMPTVPDLPGLPPDFPRGLLPDLDVGHYRPMPSIRTPLVSGEQVLTAAQVRQMAAGFLNACGIPLAPVFERPPDPDVDLEAAFEGITIHTPGVDPTVNTRVIEPGTQHPEHNWDSAQEFDTRVLDQPCYRCGAGRVALSDLTGLCDPCKKELTG